MGFSIDYVIMGAICFVLHITVHEAAHAFASDRLGDTTPRLQGRVTLNPAAHLDPVGSIMVLLALMSNLPIIGWGKPVMINPLRYRNYHRDQMLVSIAGPASNLVIAVIAAVALRMRWVPDVGLLQTLVVMLVYTGLGLMLFNLLPIPPLDGAKVLSWLLPREAAYRYETAMARLGFIPLLLLVMTGVTRYLIGVPMQVMAAWLLGRSPFA